MDARGIFVHRREVLLSGCDAQGRLYFPGRWVQTWVRLPHMPWLLASLEPCGLRPEEINRSAGES